MSYRVEKWQSENAPDVAELRKIMTAEGYSVFEWADPPDAVYSDHQHGEDQSHWVVSGILELTVAGVGRVILEPGDRDFMPADTVHSACVPGDAPVLYLIGRK